jgi:hypothetical protein
MRHAIHASLAVVLLCLGTPLAAQRVSGHVHEALSNAAVPGAIVTLFDASGKTVTRTVTNAAGAYRLVGNGQGRSLTVLRIGFKPVTQPLAGTPTDTALVDDIAMSMLPAVLEAVAVHDQTRCPAVATGPAAFALWDQARTALLAEIVSREVNPATVRLVGYAKRLDTRGLVQQQSIDETDLVASRSFVSARSAREFEQHGYRDTPDSVHRTYYAPDADVLLDSAFLRGHCLSMHDADAAHANEDGIAFAPVSGQDSLVDVSGVLWLAHGKPALRTLDFEFTNLTREEMRAHAGGTLTFTEMPNGISMISSWNLHTPVVRRETAKIGEETVDVAVESLAAIAGYNEIGSALASATWADGTAWHANLPTIGGRVVVTGSQSPLGYSLIRVRGTHIDTEADSLGRFVMPSVVPGHYTLEATDGLLAQLGFTASGSADVDVGTSPVDGITIILPSRERPVTSWCSKAIRPTSAGPRDDKLIVGKVLFANGTPVDSASVVAEWSRPGGGDEDKVDFHAITNAQGTFAMCGMPQGTPISFLATHGAVVGTPTVISVGGQHFAAPVRLVLPGSAEAQSPRRR